ncbi:unnamed protein product [Darwinula stevensoni]|uniref:Uncharacterized protein n=1 Tax=Darwinula stevensoni TaxID=69355 RepID=A0A7R8XJI8_9CRUS|nr:unnamed protein product [Darwinula stevensoni]CAG0894867.1 unnamed protein product [Darwinula stevensoni]
MPSGRRTFESRIRIRNKPILPPLMNERKRDEMREWRKKASDRVQVVPPRGKCCSEHEENSSAMSSSLSTEISILSLREDKSTLSSSAVRHAADSASETTPVDQTSGTKSTPPSSETGSHRIRRSSFTLEHPSPALQRFLEKRSHESQSSDQSVTSDEDHHISVSSAMENDSFHFQNVSQTPVTSEEEETLRLCLSPSLGVEQDHLSTGEHECCEIPPEYLTSVEKVEGLDESISQDVPCILPLVDSADVSKGSDHNDESELSPYHPPASSCSEACEIKKSDTLPSDIKCGNTALNDSVFVSEMRPDSVTDSSLHSSSIKSYNEKNAGEGNPSPRLQSLEELLSDVNVTPKSKNKLKHQGERVWTLSKELEEQHALELQWLQERQRKEQEKLRKQFEEEERRLLAEMNKLTGDKKGLKLIQKLCAVPLSQHHKDVSGWDSSSSLPSHVSAHMNGMKVPSPLMNKIQEMKPKVRMKIGALVKGYLVRRLLKTERVQSMKSMLKESVQLWLRLQQESLHFRGIKEDNDAFLRRQLLAEVERCQQSLYEIFFELEASERMAMISRDRESKARKRVSAVSSSSSSPTSQPRRISSASLKRRSRLMVHPLSRKSGVKVKPRRSPKNFSPKQKKLTPRGFASKESVVKQLFGSSERPGRLNVADVGAVMDVY